MAQFGRAADS